VGGSCTARETLTSQAWTESVPGPHGAWKVETGGGNWSAAVTAYAVGLNTVGRAASLTVGLVGCVERRVQRNGVGRRWMEVLGHTDGRGLWIGKKFWVQQNSAQFSRLQAGFTRFAGGVCCGSSRRVSLGEFFVLGAVFLNARLGRHRLFLFARAALAARRISTARYDPRCCTPHPDLNAQFHEEEGNRAIVLCMTTGPDERTSANSRTPLPHPTAWLHVYCQYLPSPIPPKIAAPMPKRRPE
jgi:hypothetical protein